MEGSPPAWIYLTSISNLFRSLLEFISQLYVLLDILSGDQEIVWMALPSFAEPIMSWWNRPANLDAGEVPAEASHEIRANDNENYSMVGFN